MQVVTKLTLVIFGIERHLHEWFNYSLYKTATKVLMIVMKYFLNINQPTNNLDHAMSIMYYIIFVHIGPESYLLQNVDDHDYILAYDILNSYKLVLGEIFSKIKEKIESKKMFHK